MSNDYTTQAAQQAARQVGEYLRTEIARELTQFENLRGELADMLNARTGESSAAAARAIEAATARAIEQIDRRTQETGDMLARRFSEGAQKITTVATERLDAATRDAQTQSQAMIEQAQTVTRETQEAARAVQASTADVLAQIDQRSKETGDMLAARFSEGAQKITTTATGKLDAAAIQAHEQAQALAALIEQAQTVTREAREEAARAAKERAEAEAATAKATEERARADRAIAARQAMLDVEIERNSWAREYADRTKAIYDELKAEETTNDEKFDLQMQAARALMFEHYPEIREQIEQDAADHDEQEE